MIVLSLLRHPAPLPEEDPNISRIPALPLRLSAYATTVPRDTHRPPASITSSTIILVTPSTCTGIRI